MRVSEDRISHLSHMICDKLWRDDLADFPDEARALQSVKESISSYFAVAEEVDQAVCAKLASHSQPKAQDSREWEVLYHKFYQEEMSKRKW